VKNFNDDESIKEVFAGRHDTEPKKTKYNLSGLPVGRKWLTSREWKGRHIRKNDVVTRSRFKHWKQIHIETFVKFFGAEIQKEVNDNFPDLCASVIIAQAIIESNFGLSRIAVEGNALFGHKHKSKSGKYIVAHDDSPTDRFSVYPSQWFSIRAHSHLMNDKYKKRIVGEYNQKNWLIALCGGMTAKQSKKYHQSGNYLYATSCMTPVCYSEKLRRIINQYDLTRFDKK
jgi:flagellum-specific peptidoglycan hydrolase FlgJ